MTSGFESAKAFVNGMSDAATVLDAELRIAHFNSVYVAMTGLKRRNLDKTIAEGRDPLTAATLTGGLVGHRRQCMLTKQPVRLAELALTTEAGRSLTVMLTMIPVLEGERAVGLVEYMRDVTDDVRVQARYQELLALEQARTAGLERQVEERTRELQVALEEVTRLSRTDPLTGLLNRRSFGEYASNAISMAARHERSLALIVGDLDHFKRVNDTYGHKVGDQVLIATAKAITSMVRTSDHVARFGGEEFVILLTETAPDAVMHVAERICEAVRSIDMSQMAGNANGHPAISLGVSVFPEHGATLDELVTRADEALYHVKQHGRDHAELYVASVMSAPAPSAPHTVLAIGGEWLQRSGYAETLADGFEVVHVRDLALAEALCRQRSFDVVIAGQKDAREFGVEALAITLHDRPSALRLLVIDDEDLFLGTRGTAVAQVDYFLLHRDVRQHLRAAIEDGITRKDVSRQILLRAGASLSGTYAGHLERLERILDKELIRFAYQPIVRAKQRTPYAEEALCRVEDPLFRDPTVLFDAAVQRGAIWRLGRLVRSIAPRALPALLPEQLLFVNLHPAEVSDPELGQSVDPALASRLVFELTERSAISDIERFREQIDVLRARGFRIAVDDLGAGYASLNTVALLEPDFLKIDMAIIRGIDESLSRSRLVRRIVEFADDQGIQVIAEGIETQAEAEVCEELGCHLLQGYLFGKPRPL